MKNHILLLKLFRVSSLVLLFFIAITATYGGWELMRVPDGSSMGLDLNLLSQSVFHDYLIPGVVLFVFNGLSSFFVAWLTLKKSKHYYGWIVYQGIVIFIWITTQIVMIKQTYFLQLVYESLEALLVFFGVASSRME